MSRASTRPCVSTTGACSSGRGQPLRHVRQRSASIDKEIAVAVGATLKVGEVQLTLEQHVAGAGPAHRGSRGLRRPRHDSTGRSRPCRTSRCRAADISEAARRSRPDAAQQPVAAGDPEQRRRSRVRRRPGRARVPDAARVVGRGAHRARAAASRRIGAAAIATLSRTVVRRVMRSASRSSRPTRPTDPHLGVTGQHPAVQHPLVHVRAALEPRRGDRRAVRDSPRIARFGPTDLDAFTALANAAAVAIEQARLVEPAARRDTAPRAAAAVSLASGRQPHPARRPRAIAGMHAQEREVTVMFCDIVGFTSLCERISPAQAATMLNAFLTRMTDVVFDHEGTLDKFLGDALLAVFGAPFEQQDHARHAPSRPRSRCARRSPSSTPSTAGPTLEMRIAINDRQRTHGRHWFAQSPRVHGPRRRRQHGVAHRRRSRRPRRDRRLGGDDAAREGFVHLPETALEGAPRESGGVRVLRRRGVAPARLASHANRTRVRDASRIDDLHAGLVRVLRGA